MDTRSTHEDGLRRTLRRAGRRERLRRAIRGAGTGLAAALLIGLIVLLADRGLGLGLDSRLFPLLAAAGLAVGAGVAGLSRVSRWELALRLDRRLRLADRVATAAALDEAPPTAGHDPAFADIVRRDADRLARSADVRTVTPIRITPAWPGAAILAGVLWAGVAHLPIMPWAQATPPVAETPEEAARREAVAESIEEAVTALEETDGLDTGDEEDLSALRALAEQLDEEGAPADDLRDESALRLDEMARRLADEAERDAAAADEITQRFADLATPDAPPSARALDEALRGGEFGAAGDELEQLLDRAGDLSDEQRRALAEHLRDLGALAQESSRAPDPAMESRRSGLEDALRDQGIDPAATDDLLVSDEPRREAIEETLRDLEVEEETAEDLAREIDDFRSQRDIEQEADRTMESVADALREASERLEPEPPLAPEPEVPGEDERPPDAPVDERPDDTPPPPPPPEGTAQEPPSEPPPPSGAPPQQPAPQQPAPQQPAPQQPAPQPTPASEQQQQQSTERSSRRPEDVDAEQQGEPSSSETTPTETAPEPGTPRDGTERAPAEGERDAGGDPRPQPAEPTETPSDERAPVPAAEPTPGADDTPQRAPSPAQTLREIQRRRESAGQRRDAAERARESARRIADQMSEEDRRRWTEAWQREAGERGPGTGATPLREQAPRPTGAGEDDVVDLADDDATGAPIAEWLTDEPLGDPADAAPGAAPAARVRAARRAAERAIDEGNIPTRYHRFIRRYFGRLEDDTGAADGAGEEP